MFDYINTTSKAKIKGVLHAFQKISKTGSLSIETNSAITALNYTFFKLIIEHYMWMGL